MGALGSISHRPLSEKVYLGRFAAEVGLGGPPVVGGASVVRGSTAVVYLGRFTAEVRLGVVGGSSVVEGSSVMGGSSVIEGVPVVGGSTRVGVASVEGGVSVMEGASVVVESSISSIIPGRMVLALSFNNSVPSYEK